MATPAKYIRWIRENIRDYTDAYAKCREVSQRMQQAFPELKLVRGHYHCPHVGEYPHWWLIDPSNRIIDPTALQFPSKGVGQYEPWPDNKPEPTGKCINCGDYTYNGDGACSESCYLAIVASLS